MFQNKISNSEVQNDPSQPQVNIRSFQIMSLSFTILYIFLKNIYV